MNDATLQAPGQEPQPGGHGQDGRTLRCSLKMCMTDIRALSCTVMRTISADDAAPFIAMMGEVNARSSVAAAWCECGAGNTTKCSQEHALPTVNAGVSCTSTNNCNTTHKECLMTNCHCLGGATVVHAERGAVQYMPCTPQGYP